MKKVWILAGLCAGAVSQATGKIVSNADHVDNTVQTVKTEFTATAGDVNRVVDTSEVFHTTYYFKLTLLLSLPLATNTMKFPKCKNVRPILITKNHYDKYKVENVIEWL